jgi:hypothetical protein
LVDAVYLAVADAPGQRGKQDRAKMRGDERLVDRCLDEASVVLDF